MKGLATVRAFMAEHGTDIRIFGRARDPRRLALRAGLIRQLHSEGLNNSEIARVIQMDARTVSYWLSDDARQGKKAAVRTTRRVGKIYRWWDECAKAMEART